ncbi:unnamed protein product, partial [Chrysoparadoxa australica]
HCRSLSLRPIATKCVTSGLISCIGDVLSQMLAASGATPFRLDIKRTTMYSMMGTFYFPFILHFWFSKLQSKLAKVALQISLDQTAGAALVNAGFFAVYTVVQSLVIGTGGTPLIAAGKETLATKFWPTMQANWKLWPFANALNFWFVPPNLRVLFSNVVALAWNVRMAEMPIRNRVLGW